jgi:hypothetical protein
MTTKSFSSVISYLQVTSGRTAFYRASAVRGCRFLRSPTIPTSTQPIRDLVGEIVRRRLGKIRALSSPHLKPIETRLQTSLAEIRKTQETAPARAAEVYPIPAATVDNHQRIDQAFRNGNNGMQR